MAKETVTLEFPYEPIGSFRRFDPYVITYIYPKKGHKNYVMKGGINTVREKMDEMKLGPAVVHKVYYHHGTHWLSMEVSYNERKYPFNIYLMKWRSRSDSDHRFHKKHWELSVHKKGTGENLFSKRYRRPPRGWIKELNQFLED